MMSLSLRKTLALFFCFICGLIFIRIYLTHTMLYIFLIWNIFLAFVPYQLSLWLFKKGYHNIYSAILFMTWLLFFPNALYIITDLIHLKRDSLFPVWYDAVLIFSSALLGLILAFISLSKVEEFLRLKFSNRKVDLVIPLVLFLGSFGVYLGRFLRWNSWDIIQNPVGLISSVADRFLYPMQHIRTWGLTSILTALFYLLYLTLRQLPNYYLAQHNKLKN